MDNQTDLSLYKPSTTIMEAFEVNENLPERQMSFEVFKKLLVARKTQDMVFLALGKLLKLMKDRELYRFLDFETFTDFLASEELSFSKEKAYMYIRIYEFYSEHLELGEDAIKDFPVARLSLMLPELKKLETKEEQLQEIERVKALRHNDFIRELKESKNTTGKPEVYYSQEAERWIIHYYDNTTALVSLGDFIPPEGDTDGDTEGSR